MDRVRKVLRYCRYGSRFIILFFILYFPFVQGKPLGEKKIPVYTEYKAATNHFIPSNYMDGALVRGALVVNQNWQDNPYSGKSAIRLQYTHPENAGYYGGGMYWAYPANNWGKNPAGINLTGVRQLTFAMRSDTPGEMIYILIGGIGYQQLDGVPFCDQPSQPYPDSVCPPIKLALTLEPDWKVYTIDLTGENQRDFHKVIGGFGFWASKSVTVYLDDIIYHAPLDTNQN